MKKLIIALLFVAFVVTGCGSNKERVIIYASTEEYRNQEMIAQLKEQFPQYDIVVQYISTGNNAAKVKTEGKAIEADIIHGLELAHAEALKENFASLDFNLDHYLDGVNPEHGKYVMWEKYTASIIINKTYFEANNLPIPATYDDLLNPVYEGLIAMPDPKTSGTGYMYVLNVLNVYGEDAGYAYFDELQKNIKQFTSSGSGPINLLNQGEIAIAMGMTFHGADEITKGANYEIIELDTFTPYNYTASSIIDGKETRECVREVFEWLITEWNLYDKENFVPSKILEVQENYVANFPSDLQDADMTGVESSAKKDEIISKWKY